MCFKSGNALTQTVERIQLARFREYYIPDFSAWKNDHDHYKLELDRLVRDLMAVPEKTT